MLKKFYRYLKSIRSLQKINISLARGGATSALRAIDLKDPSSWEFSGFSQNGEDGIIDVLTRHLKNPNYYFVEIGASDGLENNTSWLAIARRYKGIWIEGDPAMSDWCSYLFSSLNYGLEIFCMFATKDNISELKGKLLYMNPDVFSLDIDGNDYYIAEAALLSGMRPKIFIVEFNSAFGPYQAVTIPYHDNFKLTQSYGENLYYGCSIGGWKKLFSRFGYSFVTVDKNGVNAFFVNPDEFSLDFFVNVQQEDFAENFSQLRQYRMPWSEQFLLISNRTFVSV